MRLNFMLLLFASLVPQAVVGLPPVADVHVHYKWSQEDVTSPEQAIARLVEQNVQLAVVIGTPAHYALRLKQLAPEIIVPVWSPYRTSSSGRGGHGS